MQLYFFPSGRTCKQRYSPCYHGIHFLISAMLLTVLFGKVGSTFKLPNKIVPTFKAQTCFRFNPTNSATATTTFEHGMQQCRNAQPDCTAIQNLSAPYLEPVLDTVKTLCFSRKPRPPDIFDKISNVLRIPSPKLRSDIAILQHKQVSELSDDNCTRALLGKIIMHTASRQKIKEMFYGIPPEILEKMQHYLLSTERLCEFNEYANRTGYTIEEWSKLTRIERKNLVYASVASKPRGAEAVLVKAINSTGLGNEMEFLVNFIGEIRLETRGGKRFARKMITKNKNFMCKQKERLEAADRQGIAQHADSGNTVWEDSYLWHQLLSYVKAECGSIRNKIKHDLYYYIFGVANMLNSTLSDKFVPNLVTEKCWESEKQVSIDSGSLSNDEMKKVAQHRRKALDAYAESNPQELWNILDVLLDTAGFKPRFTLLAAVSRILADRRYRLELKHFQFSGFGAPFVDNNSTSV